MELESIAETIRDPRQNIVLNQYTHLQLASPDAYITFEGEDGQKLFRSKIWSQKEYTPNGVVEMLLMREYRPKGEGDWYPFLFRSQDPEVTAASLFDTVRKQRVDPSNRLNILSNIVSWSLIGILLWLIIGDIQIDLTVTFFLMVLGFALAIALAFFYEKKRIETDTIHVATIFADGPPLAISRSFVHPVSGKVMRFAGEVTPVQLKTSRISFARIRGYSVSDIRGQIDYAEDISQYKTTYMFIEAKYNPENYPEATKEERQNLQAEYEKKKAELNAKRIAILQRHEALLKDGVFDTIIKEAEMEYRELSREKRIEDELAYRTQEFKSLHALKTQAEIERDKAIQEAQSWMHKANSDLARNDVVVAAKLAKLIRDGALVDSYSPSNSETKSEISGVNAVLFSSLVSFVPFVVLFVIGMMVYNSLKSTIEQIGPWGSLLYLLIMTFVLIFGAVFVFNYTKSRIEDSMKNQSASKKMVMT